jgi:hypothetical protein
MLLGLPFVFLGMGRTLPGTPDLWEHFGSWERPHRSWERENGSWEWCGSNVADEPHAVCSKASALDGPQSVHALMTFLDDPGRPTASRHDGNVLMGMSSWKGLNMQSKIAQYPGVAEGFILHSRVSRWKRENELWDRK